MTISHLSFNPSSRWAEVAAARSIDAKEREPKPAEKTEQGDAERTGPRRSPLFTAIKQALTELVAPAAQTDTTAAGEATPAAPADADSAADSEALDQAITEFARALMHALREGRGPHGEGRGHHYGHAHGHQRHGWDNAAQRVEKLAQELAPAPAPQPVEAPVTALPVEQAETVPATEITAAPATDTAAAPKTAPAPAEQNLHVKIDLGLAESPWKSIHDDLIESFAELQRAIGGPDSESEDSLEERLSEMLVALAVKLQTDELHTAALAPAGSLLSVVA